MEFKRNRFYRLKVELEGEKIFIPHLLTTTSYYDEVGTKDTVPSSNLYGTYGTYGVYQFSNTALNYNNLGENNYYDEGYFYVLKRKFTIGNIYQALGKNLILNDEQQTIGLRDDEITCFEEVDIGLTDEMKKFIDNEKEINVTFHFNLPNNNTIHIYIDRCNRYFNCNSAVDANFENINDMIYKGYQLLRNDYARQIKNLFFHSFCQKTFPNTYTYNTFNTFTYYDLLNQNSIIRW